MGKDKLIDNNGVNIASSLSHRTNTNGRSKYVRGQSYYGSNTSKMISEPIPAGYVQEEAPANNAFAEALNAALAEQKDK